MPELSPEQVAEQFTSAWNWEWNRRSRAAGGLLVDPSPQDMADINQVAAMAVARLQHTVAAPATNDHPLVLALQAQSRQLDYALKANSHRMTPAIRDLVMKMQTWTVMIATIGVQPSQWPEMAGALHDANVDLVAQLIFLGITELPPADDAAATGPAGE